MIGSGKICVSTYGKEPVKKGKLTLKEKEGLTAGVISIRTQGDGVQNTSGGGGKWLIRREQVIYGNKEETPM